MKNRYDNLLKDFNEEILALTPANQTMRVEMALEMKKYFKLGMRVIDLGVGEGHSAEDVLRLTEANLDALDVSPEMIEVSKKRLERFESRTNFICQDANDYLSASEKYDIILSTWTIHNFVQEDKIRILKTTHSALSENGVFILMDKVYPDSEHENLFHDQIKRYSYLPNDVKEAIIKHEYQDSTDDYRQDEMSFLALMKNVGFKDIGIVDRITRDVLIIAYK